MIWLGVDWGERRIGLAVFNEEETLAVMSRTLSITSPEDGIDQVHTAAKETQAGGIVLGLPVRPSGKAGPEQKKILTIAQSLRDLGWTVELQDERFTTAGTHRLLKEAGLSRKKRMQTVDSAAAQSILSTWIETRTLRKKREEGE